MHRSGGHCSPRHCAGQQAHGMPRHCSLLAERDYGSCMVHKRGQPQVVVVAVLDCPHIYMLCTQAHASSHASARSTRLHADLRGSTSTHHQGLTQQLTHPGAGPRGACCWRGPATAGRRGRVPLPARHLHPLAHSHLGCPCQTPPWCSPIVSCEAQAWKSLVPATPSPAQLGQMEWMGMSLLQGQVSGPGAGQPAINEERTRPTRPSPRPSVARS